ncbi:hypothetical protein [Pseudobacillus badius]|uniref:hypothetical protein n=1 Tax=Bacillus badius TaxID=1455 RepID=UPI0007B3BC8B|nr:hypothetical protein [Bacillus badius]KZR56736.1 hypothetical protein A3781_20635 [Bacillus badius]
MEEKSKEIPSGYKSEIKNFTDYCLKTGQEEFLDVLLDYLYISMLEEKVKRIPWKNNWLL